MTTRPGHRSATYDVVVIGGGASGLIAAGRAAERGRRVLLLEKNEILGYKLSMTGGGRCNIMNAENDVHRLLAKYGEAEKFLHSPFSQFGVIETKAWFEEHSVPLKTEAQQRVFPASEQAQDVVNALLVYCESTGVEIRTAVTVEGLVREREKVTGVQVTDDVIHAKSVIIATGGKSHPETGSTGDGFTWLTHANLAIRQPTPSVVPIAVAEAWVKQLSGVSFDDVKIVFHVDSKRQFALKGRILCTHFGLSGPLIMNASKKIAELLPTGVVTAAIDVYPTLDLGALDAQITSIFDQHKNKDLRNVLKLLVPMGTAGAIATLIPHNVIDKKVHSVTKEERKALTRLLKALPVTVTGLMGYDRAVVTDGGLAIQEVDSKTMSLRKYPNVHVTGDMLDISRPSGGFSLQLCWTTGYVAGNSV